MAATVTQITPGALPNGPQGFVRLRIKGENLEETGAQLLITRTGAQGGPEYLRAYNGDGRALTDDAEVLQYRWGADEGRILPFGATTQDGELYFDLGRNVNALLDQQSNYRLQLYLGGQPVHRECTVAWSRVAPVRPGDLATFVPKPAKAPPIPKVTPVTPVEPHPVGTSGSATQGGAFDWGIADSRGGGHAGSESAGPEATAQPHGETNKSRLVLWSLVGLLVVAVAGALAYWLLVLNPEKDKDVAASATPPAASNSSEAKPPETREQRLTRIVARGPAAALEAGKKSQAAREIDDAEFLYRNACERGQAEGCRAAAQLYDPADLASNRATQRSPADIRQAVSLYRRAVDAGSAEAGRELERLREFVERAAQAGDSSARVLLDTWPKKP
jgi:hypothetical protein